jgi:hypothetical protein
MKKIIFLFSFAASSLFSFDLLAEQTFGQSITSDQVQQQEKSFNEDELAQMLAPIALYPDSLLTHILIASTYPIEIVEAHRWLIKNKELSTDKTAELMEDFNWDASVKALVSFDRILSRLSEDLTWTQQLGDAFLQDESRLLESIQILRKQADLAGNLEKMDNMDVSYEDSNIVIEPVEKEIVYVPYYDTRMVYGTWHSVSYPPVYWRPHHNVYVSRYSPFYFHSGIHISFNYFFSAFHWHNRHVVVANSHHSKYRYYEQRPRRLIANGGYAKRWAHKPAHRKGVAYRTKITRSKYQNKQVKVRESSHNKHRIVQKKIQHNTRDHLSVKRSKINKRSEARVSSIRNKTAKPVSKHYASIDKTKSFKSKKVYGTNNRMNKENSKKVVVKTFKKSTSKLNAKFNDSSKRNKKHQSKHQQKSRSAPLKKSHSKRERATYK